MEFFLIIFAFIGFNIVAAIANRSKEGGDSSKSSPMSVDGENTESFNDAREYVKQLKRRSTGIERQMQAKQKQHARKPQKTYKPISEISEFQKRKNAIEAEILQLQKSTAETLATLKTESVDFPEETSVEAKVRKCAFFADKNDIRKAFVASEILSKPLSLRK